MDKTTDDKQMENDDSTKPIKLTLQYANGSWSSLSHGQNVSKNVTTKMVAAVTQITLTDKTTDDKLDDGIEATIAGRFSKKIESNRSRHTPFSKKIS